MNNLSPYCGLVDTRISASDKDLPVIHIEPESMISGTVSRMKTYLYNDLLKRGR